MRLKTKWIFCVYGIAAFVAAMSFTIRSVTVSPHSTIHLTFKNYVGNDLLKLDSVIYKNVLNQPYTVTGFRYYISNISLQRKDGKQFKLGDYYLVDEYNNKSKQILLNGVTEGEYASINFIIGVDSLHNCSGAQSGALDPANGMFWAWNTGYVFMKLNGKSSSSTSPGNIFEYHIGGYKQPNNCIRTIHLDFGANYLKAVQGKENSIIIKTDVAEILKTPTTIDFSKQSSVADAKNGKIIADNYADMFSLLKAE